MRQPAAELVSVSSLDRSCWGARPMGRSQRQGAQLEVDTVPLHAPAWHDSGWHSLLVAPGGTRSLGFEPLQQAGSGPPGYHVVEAGGPSSGQCQGRVEAGSWPVGYAAQAGPWCWPCCVASRLMQFRRSSREPGASGGWHLSAEGHSGVLDAQRHAPPSPCPAPGWRCSSGAGGLWGQ